MGVLINIFDLTCKLNCKCPQRFTSLLFLSFFFCILAWPSHPQEKLLRKSSQSFVWSLHEALLSLKLLKATDPLQWFMARAFLHCNEGWRKCAQCFTLINGCDCWLTAKHTQPIYLYICLCSVFIIPSDFWLIILSIWLDFSASVVNSEVTLSAKMGY